VSRLSVALLKSALCVCAVMMPPPPLNLARGSLRDPFLTHTTHPQSAITGLDTAPCRSCDLNENHISADIPLSWRKYFYATGNKTWLASAWPALNETCACVSGCMSPVVGGRAHRGQRPSCTWRCVFVPAPWGGQARFGSAGSPARTPRAQMVPRATAPGAPQRTAVATLRFMTSCALMRAGWAAVLVVLRCWLSGRCGSV
jgi:hypothetical protein